MAGRAAHNRESGVALLLFVVLLASLVTIVMGAYVANLGGLNQTANLARQQSYVDTVAKHLSTWYSDNAVSMDGQAEPVTPGCSGSITHCLIQVGGVPQRYGVHIQVGGLKQDPSGYDYRTLVVWIPKPNVTGNARSQYQAANAAVSAAVDGRKIERSLWVRANRQLESMAAEWTAAYASWISSNGNVGVNWFQPPECGKFGGNEQMSCPTGWINLSQSGLAKATGITLPQTNPWGFPYQVCNTSACGAQQQNTPFSALIKTSLPWGGRLEQAVVEPLTTD